MGVLFVRSIQPNVVDHETDTQPEDKP